MSDENQKRYSKDMTYSNELQCKGCKHQIRDRILILLVKKDKTMNYDNVKLKGGQCKLDKPMNILSNEVQLNNQPEIYHVHCLNCFECGDRLAFGDEKCWIHHENKVICVNCRTRFKQCGRCQLQVPEDVKCGRQLYQGDKCGIFNNDVFCYEHYVTKCLSLKLLHFDADTTSNMNAVVSCQADKLQPFLMDQDNFTVGMNEDRDNQNFNQNQMYLSNSKPKSDRMTSSNTNCNTLPGSLQFNQSTTSNKQNDNFLIAPNYSASNHLQGVSNPSANSTNLNPIENCSSSDNWYSLDGSMISEEALLNNNDISLALAENGHSVDSSTSSNCSVHSKSKRIRTSFTPDQLAILQANFDVEANPDGQELERIASMAKLNKRVTQVWFQNARARKKKIECRGHLGGQHDPISLSSLACCLSDPIGAEEFYDNSKENIPSVNMKERHLLTNNSDTTNSDQLYERQSKDKVDFFNEINSITKNNNICDGNNNGKHFADNQCCRLDGLYSNSCIDHSSLITNGNELHFSNMNSFMENDMIVNKLLANTNPFGKFPFPAPYGHCMPLTDTIPHQCDHPERNNNERNSNVIKSVVTSIGASNYNSESNNSANITPISINSGEIGIVEDINMSVYSQNSISANRCGPKQNVYSTDQNIFNSIPSNHRSSNNFYIPAIALPTN
ncbi:unnamed protein product [Trichobilharzia szidati]|nr:unnamed protein product [Trichobilharzia szidati]